ncbi:MAG: response regulator [Spirochaetia bacterium]
MNKTVLIVDDNQEILQILSRYLKRNGFSVLTARSGEDAVKMLKSYLPDAVFTDLRMPGIDGKELVAEISKKHPNLPLIVISGEGTIEDAIDTLTYGAWDYIMKPVTDFEVLGKALDRALDRARKKEQVERESEFLAEKIEAKDRDLQDRNEQLSNAREELGAYLEELSRTRDNLDMVVTAAELGFWTWNSLTGKVFINDQSSRLLGMDRNVVSFPISYFQSILYPDDMPSADEWIRSLGMVRKEAVEKLAKIELRFLTGDRGYRWLEISGKVIHRREDGRILEMAGVFQDIHARKEEETRRQRLEEQLTLVLEGARIGIWEWDLVRDTIEVNDILMDMLELDDSVITIEKVREEILYPNDVDPTHELFEKLKSGALSGADTEAQVKKRDGSVGWMMSRGRITGRNNKGVPVRITGITIDISDRKKAEESLRKELEFSNRMVSTMPVMFSAHSMSGKLIMTNMVFRNTVGAVGERSADIFSLMDSDSAEKYREKIAALGDNEVGCLMLNFRSKEDPVPAEWHYSLISREGEGELILGIGIDLTERMKVEAQRRTQEKELARISKMVSLGTLASGIAHEINNPNNFISLNARNLSRLWNEFTDYLSKKEISLKDMRLGSLDYDSVGNLVPKLIQGIEEGAFRIEKLIKNLKNFIRYENGGKLYPVDLNAVLRSAVLITDDTIKKNIENFSVEYSSPVMVLGSYYELEQVFINIIANACQAVSSSGGRLRIVIREEGDTVTVIFQDNGEGMTSETISKAVDPFFTTKQERGGTGLGLSVSYNILKRMNGTVSFESREGEGTAVTVTLPRHGQSSEEAPGG